MSKDYYKTLGVERGASADEIKSAFRKLAHQHHPDKAGGDAAKFKEALEAYQVLSDAGKRKQYDQFGTTFDQAGAPGGGFGGFQGTNFDFSEMGDLSDILGDLFGGARGRGRTRREARGRDIEKDVQVTFKEAVFGAEKNIELYSYVACEHCGGRGAEPESKMKKCATCGGAGEVQVTQRTMFGQFVTRASCDACGGRGEEPEKKCKKCSGAGVARELKKLTIRIPAGVDDGGVLTVAGYGEMAPHGSAGDLYIRMRVMPDSRFERHGDDIASRVAISFKIAALGGMVKVETVDGAVELKIPAGTQPGSLFRLRGKGVPHARRATRGDHLVEVTIEVPTKLSKKQKQALEEFDDN